MRRYIGVRVLWAILIVAGIVTVNFVLTHILPGDVINALVGDFPVPQAYMDQLREQLGLNHPLYVQLWRYWVTLLHGDFGFSFVNRQSVLPLVMHRAGITLLLMVPALVVASVAGVVLAVWIVPRAGGLADSTVVAASLVGYSVPVFWLAQILILIFAVHLHWLPASGISSVRQQVSDWAWFTEYLRHLILPGFCVSLYYAAVVVRVARNSMLEMFHQDFVLTARAKGLNERAVLRRHVLRNSLIPVITVIGYNFGYSLTGAILTETVFAWPGLGGLFVSSVNFKDYPVLCGIFMLVATAVVVANLISDLLYAAVDPRVRSAVAGKA
ncbi:MAG TPA: ABC transporter permease [Burkholderiaceae bacterium]|jgi:peptide/nickel transport system permease protein